MDEALKNLARLSNQLNKTIKQAEQALNSTLKDTQKLAKTDKENIDIQIVAMEMKGIIEKSKKGEDISELVTKLKSKHNI